MSELAVLQTYHDRRFAESEKIIKAHTLYGTGAGLLPIPLLDIATLLGIQVSLVKKLAKVYGLEDAFRKKRVRRWLRILLADLGVFGVLSGVKAIPLVGPLVGMIGSPVYGGAATYAVGRIFLLHFAQGGTLLDFDPYTSRRFFRQEYDNAKQAELSKEPSSPATIQIREEIAEDYEESVSVSSQADSQLTSTVDFSKIDGIGPKISEVLSDAGIASFGMLAQKSVEDISTILKASGTRFNKSKAKTWPKQADLIANQQWDELEQFQTSLKV